MKPHHTNTSNPVDFPQEEKTPVKQDKIFELGRQATIWCCNNLNPDTPKEEWDATWEQKFAESLIRECADYVDSAISDGGIDGRGLKEHFGVK